MTTSLNFANFAHVTKNTAPGRTANTISVNGTTVAALRGFNGFGLKELSEASTVSQSYICEIERGTKTNVRPATLKKLADALGVPIAVLARDPEAAEKAYRQEVA